MTIEQGGRVRWVIEADSQPLEDAITDAGLSVDSLKKKIEDTDSSIKNGGLFSDISKQAQSATTSLADLGKSIASIASGTLQASAATLTTTLAGLTKKGLAATDFLETSRVAMSGLTGSMAAGNKAMSIAANFWSNNPFQRIDVTKATQQLVQYGRTTNQLADDLKILGDISLSSGAPIDELARYFGRTAAAGRAMTLDIEMLSDRGIPIYRELAEVMHTTQSGVRDLASQGKIDFETFRKALENAVDPEAMAQYEDTLARQKDRLSGSINILAGDLAGYKIVNDELVISANGLEKAYTRFIQTLATGLRDKGLREGMEKIGQALAQILDKITAKLPAVLSALSKIVKFVGENKEMLLPILAGALMLFGRLGQQIPVVNQLIGGLNSNIGRLTKSLSNLASRNPILAVGLGVLVTSLVQAYKSSEEFRNAIQRIFSAIGKVAKSIMPALQKLVQSFVDLASSPAIISVITAIADALAFLADTISHIPTELLQSLIISLTFLAIYKHNKILAIASAITVVVGAFSRLWDALKNTMGGVGNMINSIISVITLPFTTLIKFLSDLVIKFFNFGKSICEGLAKGLSTGFQGVSKVVTSIATSISSIFKKLLGIHSPSTVFTKYGEFISLGLANGITSKSSAVDKAIDKLATATLQKAKNVISNKLDFGVLNYNTEYKAWKKIAQLFTQGSEQYESALENMEEARKKVNQEIISLQNTYNTELDNTIDRLKTMYSIFQKVDTSETGMNAEDVIANLDKQVAKLQTYASSQQIISGLGLDSGLVDELKSLGVDSAYELQAIANMTASQLEDLNTLWLKKQSIATEEATRQMENLKDKTLQQITDLKEGIDGETVDVKDVGGRLVSEISEGITGSLPTLESAFAELGSYVSKELSGSTEEASSAVEDLGDTIQKTVDDIEQSFDDMKTTLSDTWNQVWPVLLGVVGFFAGTKLIGGISKVGSAFGGLIGKLKGVANPAKKAGEAIGSIGGSTSKISSAGASIKDVAVNFAKVIAIAAEIAALAIALKFAYDKMKDIDFGKLLADLGVMAGVIVAMGGISYVIGKFAWKEMAKGLVVIAGIALDLILLAQGMGELDRNMQSDFDVMVGKIGAMGIAILEIGVLGGIIGGLIAATGPIGALVAAGGIATLLGIALDIAELGKALGELDRGMQSDFNVMVGKIGAMGAVVSAIGALATGEGIVNFLTLGATSNGIEQIKKSGEAVIAIAQAIKDINEVQGLNIDENAVTTKFGVIKRTLEGIQGFTSNGLVGNVIQFFAGGGFDVNKVKDLATGVKAIAEVGKPLAEMPELPGNADDKLEPIKRAMGKLNDIKVAGNMEEKRANAEKAIEVIKQYVTLAGELEKLKNVDTSVESVNKITNTVNNLVGDVLKHLDTRVGEFRAKINTIIDTMVQAANERNNDVVILGQTFGDKFIEGMNSKKDAIGNAAKDWQSVIWHAIQPKLQDEFYQGQALANEFRNGVASVDMAESGRNAAQGFLNGIIEKYTGSWNSAYRAGWDLAQTVLQGIKDRGKEGSPWKTTFQSGVWAAEGLYRGIRDSESLVVGEAKTLADQVVDALEITDTTMTPTLSTSSLPLMSFDEGYEGGYGRRNVIIEQTNNNYTDYSIQKLNSDLAWEISKV